MENGYITLRMEVRIYRKLIRMVKKMGNTFNGIKMGKNRKNVPIKMEHGMVYTHLGTIMELNR